MHDNARIIAVWSSFGNFRFGTLLSLVALSESQRHNASMALSYALRSLRRTPAFTIVAVGSLALGIGANTAIFSFVNAILLKRLPVPEPERLVSVSEYQGGKVVNTVFSYPFVEQLNKRAKFFDGVFGCFPVRVNLTGQNASEPLHGEVVTGEYFHTLRVKPAFGRLLNEEDVSSAVANPVCVLSYSTWHDRFNGDPHIIGRTLMLNSHPYRVIGVTERGFYGAQLQSRADLQLPLSRMGDFMGGFFSTGKGGAMWRSPAFSWLEPLGRLRNGTTAAQAGAMLQPLASGIRVELADAKNREEIAVGKNTFRLEDGSQGASADLSKRDPLLVLMGVVGLVLLVACVNVANLLLARAKTREKEFALRLSLGAAPLRLARQLLAESLVLALVAGAFGILISVWLTQSLLTYFNAGSPAGEGLRVRLDPLVLCFAIAVTLLTALVFGLFPALQSAKVDVLPGLKGVQMGHTGSRDWASLRKLLIVVQLALSVCLLFAAGLLTRTLSHLRTIDLGFRPAQVVVLSIDPAMAGYKRDQVDRTFDEIVSRLEANPSVAAASYAVASPLEGSMISIGFSVPGHAAKSSDLQVDFNMVSPGYFKTLDQPLLAGRDFSARDTEKAPQVAIVNQLFAAQEMPGMNPIGRHFLNGGSDTEIVGLVKNARYQQMREKPVPLVYLPTAQTKSSGYSLLVRLRANVRRGIPEIERTIGSVNKRIPILNARTLQAQIDSGLSSERILSFLSALFAVLATVLCCVGLYGIVAFGVTSRTREIGIRVALGSTRSGVAKLFLAESLLVVGIGVAIGIPLALASARLLKSLLYGLRPNDLATLFSICLILVLAGLFATALPLRKAVRVEPSEALRHE